MTSVPGYPCSGGQQEECIQGTDCSWVRWCEDWANSIIWDRSHEQDPWVSGFQSPWKGTTNIILSSAIYIYVFLLLPSPRYLFWCTPACDLWAFTFFVQVPVLETPEGAIAESNAIARYGTLNPPWFYSSSLKYVKCGTGDWCWPAHLVDQSVFLLWDCFVLKLQASFCTCWSQLQEALGCDGRTVQSTGSWLVGLSHDSCLLKGFVVLFQSFLLVMHIQWQDSRMWAYLALLPLNK